MVLTKYNLFHKCIQYVVFEQYVIICNHQYAIIDQQVVNLKILSPICYLQINICKSLWIDMSACLFNRYVIT